MFRLRDCPEDDTIFVDFNRISSDMYYRPCLSKMYTCEEVAERYSVKVITVWDWIRKKKLNAIKLGREYRVSEDDLLQFEKERRTIQ